MTEADGTPPAVTPEEVKANQIFDYMGFEDVKTFSEFQDKFGQEYVKRNLEVIRGDEKLYGQLLGAKTNGTVVALKRALKTKGIPFADDDFKDAKIENIVESWTMKVADHNANKVTELEEKLKLGSDARVTELETKYNDVNTKFQEATQKLSSIETEWTDKLTKKEQEFKDLNKKNAEDKTWGGVKYANGVDELKKKGFIATVKESVVFDFDEAGKFVPLKDGKKIPNPAKADTFYDAEEYVKQEAIKAGVYAVSPHGGAPAPAKKNVTTTTTEEVKLPHQMINPIRPKVRAGV